MNSYFVLKVAHVISATVLFGTGLGIAFFKWIGPNREYRRHSGCVRKGGTGRLAVYVAGNLGSGRDRCSTRQGPGLSAVSRLARLGDLAVLRGRDLLDPRSVVATSNARSRSNVGTRGCAYGRPLSDLRASVVLARCTGICISGLGVLADDCQTTVALGRSA